MGAALSSGNEFNAAYASALKDAEIEAAKGGRQGRVVHGVKRMSHNTIVVTFEGPLLLTPGGHVTIRSDSGFSRNYTPFLVGKDSFSVAIKQYKGGKVSTYLHERVRPGDFVTMSAPIEPLFDVTSSFHGEANKTFAIVAGGTGIAPVYSMAKYVVDLPNNQSRVVLFACFRNEEEVLLGEALAALVAQAPHLVTVYFVFSKAQSTGLESFLGIPVLHGRFQAAHCKRRLEEASCAVICGPPGFGPAVADVVEQNVNVKPDDVTIM
jgi:cytochrome-b5 reductase